MAFAGLSCMALLGLPQSAVAQDMTVYPYAEDYQVITRDGAWCWFSDPRAIYVDDKMFGGFVDKEGSIWAFCYDPSTCQSKQYKLFNKLDYDDHANPSIMALSDQRLVLFFSAHVGTKNSPIYYAVSKYPSDISSWEEVQEINPEMEGSLGVCYTNPVMLSDENNRVYLFFRGRDFKPTCIYTDDLKTWSQPINLVRNDPGYGQGGRPYTKITTNHKDKIFFAFTDAHPRDRATNSIYFMMYKNGKICKADGTVVSETLGSIIPSQVDKVYDATRTFDKAWIWDIAFDESEKPILVYARFSDRDKAGRGADHLRCRCSYITDWPGGYCVLPPAAGAVQQRPGGSGCRSALYLVGAALYLDLCGVQLHDELCQRYRRGQIYHGGQPADPVGRAHPGGVYPACAGVRHFLHGLRFPQLCRGPGGHARLFFDPGMGKTAPQSKGTGGCGDGGNRTDTNIKSIKVCGELPK